MAWCGTRCRAAQLSSVERSSRTAKPVVLGRQLNNVVERQTNLGASSSCANEQTCSDEFPDGRGCLAFLEHCVVKRKSPQLIDRCSAVRKLREVIKNEAL